MKEKGSFFCQGKFFDTFEQMIEYEREWLQYTLDENTAKEKLNVLCKDICLNIFARGVEFTNREFLEYVQKIFEFSIEQLNLKELGPWDVDSVNPYD